MELPPWDTTWEHLPARGPQRGQPRRCPPGTGATDVECSNPAVTLALEASYGRIRTLDVVVIGARSSPVTVR